MNTRGWRRNCGKSWKPTRINHTEQPQRRQGLRALMAAFGASAWSVGVAGGHRGGRICLREGVGAAQFIGRPVPAGHVPDQVRRVGRGHPGGGDEQRACRGSAHDRHRVGGRMEPGPGPRRSPGCRTRRLARLARPRLDRQAGDLAGGRRREPGAIAVACATGRFRRKREEQQGPEHRGQSSCSRHANARRKAAG